MVCKSPLLRRRNPLIVLTLLHVVYHRFSRLVSWRCGRRSRAGYQYFDRSGSTYRDRRCVSDLFLLGNIRDRTHALAISRQFVCVHGYYSDKSFGGEDCIYVSTNSRQVERQLLLYDRRERSQRALLVSFCRPTLRSRRSDTY